MIKSTKYAISVRQKQKDSLASSKSLFDKGGATQRTRKSIYATAITARFFLAVGSRAKTSNFGRFFAVSLL